MFIDLRQDINEIFSFGLIEGNDFCQHRTGGYPIFVPNKITYQESIAFLSTSDESHFSLLLQNHRGNVFKTCEGAEIFGVESL